MRTKASSRDRSLIYSAKCKAREEHLGAEPTSAIGHNYIQISAHRVPFHILTSIKYLANELINTVGGGNTSLRNTFSLAGPKKRSRKTDSCCRPTPAPLSDGLCSKETEGCVYRGFCSLICVLGLFHQDMRKAISSAN